MPGHSTIRRRANIIAPLCLLVLLALAAPCAAAGDSESPLLTFLNDQLLLVATIVGSVAALPALIEFLIDRHKRKVRIALSLEDVEVSTLNPQLAGLDHVLANIADLIDRACHPRAYAGLKVGNEVLIVGPSLSGKKTFARRMAKDAAMDRLITVYNPRNADALARAKSLVQSQRRQKIMLLLPGIDLAFAKEDEELLAELEALIETTTELENVLVVGTATTLVPDSELDNLFGIKIVMPGTDQAEVKPRPVSPEARQVLTDVVRFYLKQATTAGFRLDGISTDAFEQRILQSVANPAEIEDIVALCQTSALHSRRTQAATDLSITSAILEKAISRVILGEVSRR